MTGQDMRHVEVARAVLDAVRAAEAALRAIDTALSTAGNLGVPAPGFPHLMAARGSLGALTNPHGPARALAENEIRAADPDWRPTA